MKITVALQIFSGRSAPRWTAEGDEAGLLTSLLKDRLPSPDIAPSGGLGYSGFALTLEEKGKTENLCVYAGAVWDQDRPEKVWKDQNGIEQALLKMAHQHGYGKLLQEVGL